LYQHVEMLDDGAYWFGFAEVYAGALEQRHRVIAAA
jgi:hypothetical protein